MPKPPKISWSLTFRSWYENSKRHREDGPALEQTDAFNHKNVKEWHINGRIIKKEITHAQTTNH